jgi:hypothetical protein
MRKTVGFVSRRLCYDDGMSPEVVLIGLLTLPVLVLMLLKANASLVFLSACLGAVLLTYVGSDASSFANTFMPNLSANNLKLFLVLLPVVLTTVFMIRTVNGKHLAFNVLPALGTGLLLALLVVPLLPTHLAQQTRSSELWHTLQQLQTLIVGVSALTCLFFLWMQRPKTAHDKHSKRHK